jgi:PKD repeat protein
VADFEATPTWGSPPLSVAFTNLSTPTSEVDSYTWSFGGGASGSTATAPTHAYTQYGEYSVTLTVSGTAGQNVRVRPA